MGAAGITLTPEWLKDFAIRHFGTNDKLILLIGLGAGIAAIAVIIGTDARRHPVIGRAGLGALAAALRVARASKSNRPVRAVTGYAMRVRVKPGPRRPGPDRHLCPATRLMCLVLVSPQE